MKIYDIIVEDDNGKLYSLDSAWCNENFNYDPKHDKITEIKQHSIARVLFQKGNNYE